MKITDYPELNKIAWFYNDEEIDELTALRLYERNWFYVNQNNLSEKELNFIKSISLKFNKTETINSLWFY